MQVAKLLNDDSSTRGSRSDSALTDVLTSLPAGECLMSTPAQPSHFNDNTPGFWNDSAPTDVVTSLPAGECLMSTPARPSYFNDHPPLISSAALAASHGRPAQLAASHGRPAQLAASPVKRPAEPHPAESPNKKKQSKWSPDEDALITELRGKGMKWEDIAKQLLGRSTISCRLRFQNYLERCPEWDEEKMNKLAILYDR